MPTLQRSVSRRGVRFYREGGQVMFVRHLDASTREGPRPAEPADQKDHPAAWSEFRSSESPAPRDKGK